ncbi:MAG TPA: hypothetical protein VH934_22950 [Xanthobacteraceae bacterium]|jgi:hypothetical protein
MLPADLGERIAIGPHRDAVWIFDFGHVLVEKPVPPFPGHARGDG